MNLKEVEAVVDMGFKMGGVLGVLGVKFVSTDEDEIAPWLASPSGRTPQIPMG
jgi:hypothetical protein